MVYTCVIYISQNEICVCSYIACNIYDNWNQRNVKMRSDLMPDSDKQL